MKSTIHYFIVLFLIIQTVAVFAKERPSAVSIFNNICTINSELKVIYESLPTDPYSLKGFDRQVQLLKIVDENIIFLQEESVAYSDDGNYAPVLKEIQAQRAAAFLHSWAILSTCLKQGKGNIYLSAEPDAVLTDLLTIYGQIYKSCKDEGNSPLVTYLPPDDKSNILSLKRNYYLSKSLIETVPSTKELLGQSFDEIETTKTPYTTLWAIANYQNDHLRSQQENPNVFDWKQIEPLQIWIGQMISADYPLYKFADSTKQEIEDFRNRLEKFKQYYEFRAWIANETNLEKLLLYIGTKIAEKGIPVFEVDKLHEEESTQLTNLTKAAKPDEQGEILPDAAIWLRYILLLSYQGQGSNHILNELNAKISSVFFDNLNLPLLFEETGSWKDKKNTQSATRWNQYPSKGQFSCFVDDTTRGILDMMVFQLKKSWNDANGTLAAIEKVQANNLEEYKRLRNGRIDRYKNIESISFNHQATTEEIKRLKGDYIDFVQMSDNLCKLYSAKLQLDELLKNNKLSDRFDDSALQLQQLTTAYPELTGCSPIALPTLTYSQYKNELEFALGDLQTLLSRDTDKADVMQKYHERRVDSYISRMETIAADFALQAVTLAKKQAEIELWIAGNNKKMLELRQKASEYDKAAKEHKGSAQTIKQELADEQKKFAEGLVGGTKKAMEDMQRAIADAQEELKKLQDILLESAARWEKEIKEAEEDAKMWSIIKICVRIVGAVVSIYTAGGGSVAAEAICAGISTGCDAVITGIEIYENVKVNNMSESDVWMAGFKATIGLAKTGVSIYSNYRDKEKQAKKEPKEKKLEEEKKKDWFDKAKEIYDKAKPYVEQTYKECIKFKTAIEADRQYCDALVEKAQREMYWYDISNDINIALAELSNANLINNGFVSGPTIENSDLKDKLWNVLQSGGYLVFLPDAPAIKEIVQNKNIDPSEWGNKFIGILDKLFKQIEFPENDIQKAVELGFNKDNFGESVRALKKLLQNNVAAKAEFWDKVIFGTEFYTDEVNNEKRIIVLNSLGEKYNAGWKAGYDSTVQPILDQIEDNRRQLSVAANQAENPDVLRVLAKEKIPAIVAKLQESLESLDAVLEKALSAYKDDKRKAEIEERLLWASINDLRAAEMNVEAGKLNVESAQKEIERVNLRIQEMEYRVDAANYDYQAKQRRMLSSEYQLRYAYRKNILKGDTTEQPKEITLTGVIMASIDGKKYDPVVEYLFAKICRNYCGLLQWQNFFNAKKPKTVQDRFGDLLDAVKKFRFEGHKQVSADIKSMVDDIQKQMTDLTQMKQTVQFDLFFRPIEEQWIKEYHENSKIEDFGDDIEFIAWYNANNKALSLPLPIARIDFVVSITPSKRNEKEEKGNIAWETNGGFDQFVWNHNKYNTVRIGSSSNRKSTSELKFVLETPWNNTAITNGIPILSNTFFCNPDTIKSTDENNERRDDIDKIMNGFAMDHNFYGLLGTWRFYIFSTNPQDTIKNRKEEIMKMKVYLPILRINPAP